VTRTSYVFTSESVSEGHPDKVADRISDTVVDAFLAAEPEARVACETMVTTNRIVLAGEVRAGKPGASKVENKAMTKDIIATLEPKVRAAVKDIGYAQRGFHWEKARYQCFLHGQSAHIAQGVDANAKKDEGAGDQGIMFGSSARPASPRWRCSAS
jgi:S-adenosylmethionine synthetase